jgi:hypothetical protein
MKLALSTTSASSAVDTGPHSSSYIYGPGLPVGGDYGTVLAYFVDRGRPTYGFAGMAPDMAVVAVEVFVVAFVVIVPVVYLFVDQSMTAESWYYVYRYLYGAKPFSPPPNTGPVSGSPGPLTLISSNTFGSPSNGYFCPVVLPNSSGAMPLSGVGKVKKSALAKVETMGNPMLVQISLGNAPCLGGESLL